MRFCSNQGKMPSELVERFNAGRIGRNDLFQEWLECGENMSSVLVIHKKRLTHKQRSRTVYGWKNRSELLKMYSDDAEFVDDLIGRKTREGLWAPHPEAPGNHKMVLYWVRLESTLTIDDEQVLIGPRDGCSLCL
jgi:hypothetical protein